MSVELIDTVDAYRGSRSHCGMISLRFATPDDASDFIQIYAPAIIENAASFEEALPTFEEMQSRILRINERYPWLVAADGARINGYAYASAHRDRASYRWSVDVSVYVRKEAQGKGVGSLLYTRLFELLRAQRFHRAYAGITLPNSGSVALHESFGFKKCALYTQVGYKFGAWHDVGWWELEITKAEGSPQEPLAIGEITGL